MAEDIKTLELKHVSSDMFCGECITVFKDIKNGVTATRITREFMTVSAWIKFDDESKNDYEHSCETQQEFCDKYGFKNGGLIK